MLKQNEKQKGDKKKNGRKTFGKKITKRRKIQMSNRQRKR